jgi:hypothetical protein
MESVFLFVHSHSGRMENVVTGLWPGPTSVRFPTEKCINSLCKHQTGCGTHWGLFIRGTSVGTRI